MNAKNTHKYRLFSEQVSAEIEAKENQTKEAEALAAATLEESQCKKHGYNPDDPHTNKKLDIYTRYLPIFLRIMSYTKFEVIHVYDIFAGAGTYDIGRREVEGSAVLACKKIKEFKEKFPNQNIILHLNDIDKDKHASLLEKTKSYDFVRCTNNDAMTAIKKSSDIPASDFRLFFLDPYGYADTKSYVDTIMNGASRSECLLFLPVSFISRFISKKQSNAETELGSNNFCKSYSIDISKKDDIKGENLGDTIKKAMSADNGSYCVGYAPLKANAPNIYGLYYIGKNLLGLEKFLDSICDFDKQQKTQSKFPIDNIKFIKTFLRDKKTNKQIYEFGLRFGIRKKDIVKIVTDMRERGLIYAEDVDGKRHDKKYNYLNWKSYNEPAKILFFLTAI